MSVGLVPLPERVEERVMCHIKAEMGGDEGFFLRLAKNAADVEWKPRQVLLSVIHPQRRVQVVADSLGIQKLANLARNCEVGFFPIDVITLCSFDPSLSKAAGLFEPSKQAMEG